MTDKPIYKPQQTRDTSQHVLWGFKATRELPREVVLVPKAGGFWSEFCRTHDALSATLDREEHLQDVLRQIDQMLRIPAAEYVPAIGDVFGVIDAALKP